MVIGLIFALNVVNNTNFTDIVFRADIIKKNTGRDTQDTERNTWRNIKRYILGYYYTNMLKSILLMLPFTVLVLASAIFFHGIIGALALFIWVIFIILFIIGLTKIL